MKNFHFLNVLEVNKLTADAVCIKLDISDLEEGLFDFISGQYITVRKEIKGQDVRRSYSISSAPGGVLEIGVKLVRRGLMSTYLTQELKSGDVLEVMPPMGSFLLEPNNTNENHYMAICAGSGITPILSMIRDVLANEPKSSFTLFYGNQSRSTIMFSDTLVDLEKEFQSQLLVYYIFSRQEVFNCLHGRIDNFSLKNIFEENKSLRDVNSFFLCGPGQMIDVANQFLLDLGVSENQIKFERFTSISSNEVLTNNDIISNVTVSVDGDDFNFSLSSDGETILDAAMEAGADVPFSCKGGVCCVCKAKVIEGNVFMKQNFSLSDEEVEEGFILTCQSHPDSDSVVVDFDEM